MSLPRPFLQLHGIAAIGLLALGFVCFAAGLRVNTTGAFRLACTGLSMSRWGRAPTLFFARRSRRCLTRPESADISAAGFCPGDYGFMMKRVLAHGRRCGYLDG